MKTKSFAPVGSMHPVLFFVFIYAVALIVSIFICSSLFYSCNAGPAPKLSKEKNLQSETKGQSEGVAFYK